MAIQIDKVIQVILKPDDMAKINNNLNDYWADYSEVLDRSLNGLLTNEQLMALSMGDTDYIAFRLAD